MTESIFLSRSEAAAYLDIKEPTLRMWGVRKKGPIYYKIGKYAKYKIEDLDTFIEAQKVDNNIKILGHDNVVIGRNGNIISFGYKKITEE